MYRRLDDVLKGNEGNYMLPFYWQHGDHTDTIPREVRRIYESGARAFCVESRPHKDFCGEGWWRDMDLIIREAEALGMKVWILDDDHFPTGHAGGMIAKKHPELRKWQLTERHIDVAGPLEDAILLVEPERDDQKLLGVWAYPRLGGVDEAGTDAADAQEDEVFGGKTPGPEDGYSYPEDCVNRPVELTEGVDGGYLHFSLPEGLWRVFFFYKTRRGTNKPDYIDMLSEESVRVLIDTVYESHYEHYGKYFGNTVAGFFSDEPLFGNDWAAPHSVDMGFYDHRLGMPGLALPWNDRIVDMMREALGEDPVPLFPALWFGLGSVTGEVRHAYMDAATKLYRDCFTRQLGDWCEAHGVQYIGHIIEDMNAHGRLGCSSGHYFRALDGQHMGGIDIVLHQIIPGISDHIHTYSSFGNDGDPAFFHYVLGKLCSSFARVNTRAEGRAMCEVFGAYGWAEGTPLMKWLLDYLLVRGVNHFVPHAFSPAFPDPDCPPHFGAADKDPQFEGFSRLMKYGNQAAHLLSGAESLAEVAILYHADAEWANPCGRAMFTQVPAKVLYDRHIDYDILPADCFVPGTGSDVYPAVPKAVPDECGRGRSDGAGSMGFGVGNAFYRCLVVPYSELLPEKLDGALEELEKAGVPVIRMTEDMKGSELVKAVDAALGRRRVYVDGRFPKLRVSCLREGTTQICMPVNESVTGTVKTKVRVKSVLPAEALEGSSRAAALRLDLLNDETVSCPLETVCIGGETYHEFDLELSPYQSCIIVIDRATELPEIAAPAALKPVERPELTFDIEAAGYEEPDKFGPVATGVRASELFNINAAGRDPAFSGRLRYTARFELGDDLPERLATDLGSVGQTARMRLNGIDLGIRVCPPYRFDLTRAIKKGDNVMEIVVSNTLANAVRDGFSYFLAIPASGISGPVSFLSNL
jgi:hypothetical protein